MPITSYSLAVGTAATRLVQAAGNPMQLSIHADANQDIWLGGSAVTSATGFPVRKNETLIFNLYASNILYAVSAAPATVTIMEQTF